MGPKERSRNPREKSRLGRIIGAKLVIARPRQRAVRRVRPQFLPARPWRDFRQLYTLGERRNRRL